MLAGSPELGETLTFVVLWFLPVAFFQGSPHIPSFACAAEWSERQRAPE
jgi:hypothetical protein